MGEYLFSVVVTFLVQWPAFLFFRRALHLPGWGAAFGANLLQMSVSFGLLRWRVFRHPAADAKASPIKPIGTALHSLSRGIGVAALRFTGRPSARGAPPTFSRSEGDYYNLLVAGFRKGSLAMDVPVPDALRTAANPWDPATRSGMTVLHDASYYNGHYYLYFGVVPAVVLFWPFHGLSGYDLPFVLASVGFVTGAFLLGSWLWLEILRRHFSRAGLFMKLAGMVVLGLCAGQLVLVRRWGVDLGNAADRRRTFLPPYSGCRRLRRALSRPKPLKAPRRCRGRDRSDLPLDAAPPWPLRDRLSPSLSSRSGGRGPKRGIVYAASRNASSRHPFPFPPSSPDFSLTTWPGFGTPLSSASTIS